MSTLVSVRLVFMYPELIEVVTPSTSYCHTRLVTLGYASVLHINVTLSVTFTANSVRVSFMMGGPNDKSIIFTLYYIIKNDNNAK